MIQNHTDYFGKSFLNAGEVMNFRAGPLVHAVLATEGARYVTVYVSFPGF